MFVLTQWFVKRIIIYIGLLQDYYLQMCSENTPLRLTNGVLGVFLFANSIKIVLKRVGGFVKQTNDNLTIINDLQKEIQCLKNILEREGISYQEELDQLKNSTNTEPFETNQGSRIVFPNEITKDMANRFLHVLGSYRCIRKKSRKQENE